MTTPAERLPDEVLFMIFDGYDYYDAFEVQYVSPAWYRAAHALTLKEVNLFGPDNVQNFIDAIDSNPHPAYLKAVQDITILNTEYPDRVFTEEQIRKIFFRFPNLRKVIVHDNMNCFKNMTEELCQEFLQSCPKLQQFDMEDFDLNRTYSSEIYQELYPVRSLLTSLKINPNIIDTHFKDDIYGYIIGCHNLHSLFCAKGIKTFGNFLNAMEHLPKLEDIGLWDLQDDFRGFAEYFLRSFESETEEQQFIKRLSQIKDVYWRRPTGMCVPSIKFVEKYLTGLKKFGFFTQFDQDWDDMMQRVFCQTLTEVICNVDEASVVLEMDYETLTDYLPFLMHRIFHNSATASEKTKRRVFQMNLTDDFEDADWTKMRVETTNILGDPIASVAVYHSTDADLEELSRGLLSGATPLEDIEVFQLSISNRRDCDVDADTGVYCRLVEGMWSAWKIMVDIPASFRELAMEDDLFTTHTYPLVTDLQINATSRAKFQTLIRQYSVIFPNLEHLHLNYFCGVWKPSMGEFKLALPLCRYLKSLAIDVTPVAIKMKKTLNKDSDKDFFVLHIDILSNSTKLLYKVLINSLETTKISTQDLEGLKRGQDYLRVHVAVHDLTDWFQLCRNDLDRGEGYIYKPDEDENYLDESSYGIYKVVRFNNATDA